LRHQGAVLLKNWVGTHQMEEYIRANRPSDLTSEGRGLIRGMVITDRLRR